MFPVSMATQNDRFLGALGRIVADAGDTGVLAPFLRDLGRDHRKFGALAGHFPVVGESLIATLKHFTGTGWTPELEQAWLEAYTVISDVMIQAAEEDTSPAYWNARVIGYERRAAGTALLRVAPDQPVFYRPGQSVAVECPDRPRLWRYYSIANAPRLDGTLDFQLAAQWPHFEVTPVAEMDAGGDILTGTIADALTQRGTWREHDAYVCGSSAMVEGAVSRLRSLGTPEDRIFVEDFGWSSW